jgi:flagellar basal-body rod protein FlgC
MINAIKNALSGLTASQRSINVSANNIANLQTSGSLEDADNPPYTPLIAQHKSVSDSEGNGLGVQSELIPKTTPYVPAYDPDSPFADTDGVVGVPNVSLAEEAVNIKVAGYIFEANAKVIKAVDEMTEEIHHIFDREV